MVRNLLFGLLFMLFKNVTLCYISWVMVGILNECCWIESKNIIFYVAVYAKENQDG